MGIIPLKTIELLFLKSNTCTFAGSRPVGLFIVDDSLFNPLSLLKEWHLKSPQVHWLAGKNEIRHYILTSATISPLKPSSAHQVGPSFVSNKEKQTTKEKCKKGKVKLDLKNSFNFNDKYHT